MTRIVCSDTRIIAGMFSRDGFNREDAAPWTYLIDSDTRSLGDSFLIDQPIDIDGLITVGY